MHQNIKNSKTKSQNFRFLNKRRGLLQKAAPPRLIEIPHLIAVEVIRTGYN